MQHWGGLKCRDRIRTVPAKICVVARGPRWCSGRCSMELRDDIGVYLGQGPYAMTSRLLSVSDRIANPNSTRPGPLSLIDLERGSDCLLIVLSWAAIAVIINPFQNTPLIDDWVYAWPVEELFRHQTLKVID